MQLIHTSVQIFRVKIALKKKKGKYWAGERSNFSSFLKKFNRD